MMMEEKVSRRKVDHIEICLNDNEVDRLSSGLEKIRLINRALPEINYDEIDLSVNFLGKELSMPLIISSMTGGCREAVKINRNLALAAEKTKVALALGSQRVIFNNHDVIDSFDVRKFAPSTVLIGNLGAVQLNYGFGIEECEQAVKLLDADGLYLHLNALQEVIQGEGDRNFSDLVIKIKQIASKLSVPLLLKEVGCGMSRKDFDLLNNCQLAYVDVAGRGGSSWSYIEQMRTMNNSLGNDFCDWGMTMAESMREARGLDLDFGLIASGGLRSGMDLAKAIILGAKLGGVALPFLKAAEDSVEAVVNLIEKYRKQLHTTMFLLGVKRISDLILNDSLIIGYNEEGGK